MRLLADLARDLRAWNPGWAVRLEEGGRSLVVSDATRETPAPEDLRFVFSADGKSVVVEDLWRIPVRREQEQEVRRRLVQFVADGFENHGWEVPIMLEGGPRHGRRLSKPWEDLLGRLVLARRVGGDGGEPEAHIYKWHLRRNEDGEYLCRYERTLRGAAVDDFIARGVESTGPFVLIHAP